MKFRKLVLVLMAVFALSGAMLSTALAAPRGQDEAHRAEVVLHVRGLLCVRIYAMLAGRTLSDARRQACANSFASQSPRVQRSRPTSRVRRITSRPSSVSRRSASSRGLLQCSKSDWRSDRRHSCGKRAIAPASFRDVANA